MSLAPGSRIGPYEIRGLIGAGGMGEVYRATDSRLGRDVAIKMLPAEVAADAERLGRFRREAQVLASLNHPNIAAIHGLEDAGGTPCLVLELVEGEDLAQRLARGPIPPDEAIDIARHIAEALEEAHEKGIVHRDLKPANVKVTPDGKVKVLDFGLAKALTGSEAAGAAGSDLSQSPTLVQSGTRAGMILGTAAYMSPEQARGRAVDRRADIWAFGAVLWEMLTGTALFAGETITDVLAAVLTRDPDWSALPPSTPPRLAALLRRCIERDPRRRLQAMGEARLALEPGSGGGLIGVVPATGVAGKRSGDSFDASTVARGGEARRPSRLVTAGFVVIGAAAGALAMRLFSSPPAAAPANRSGRVSFSFAPPASNTFTSGMDLSRDGRSIVFVAADPGGQRALWVRNLDAVEPRRLAGTEGARFPFWAPDGRRIGFFAASQLKVVDLIGGAVRSVARTTNTADVRGGAWGADDTIVFTPSFIGVLQQVPAAGGAPIPATKLDLEKKDGSHRWPCFLPDGRRFVFYASAGSGTEPGEIRLATLGSTATQVLGSSHSRAVVLPPNRLLYVIGDMLVAQEADFDRAVLVGEPSSLGMELRGSIGISGFRYLAAAAPDMLVTRRTEGSVSTLVWADRAGKALSIAADDGGWHDRPRIAPDGKRVSVVHYSPGQSDADIHVHDNERGLDTRVTFDAADDQAAAWTPDGRALAITSSEATNYAVSLADPARPGERVNRRLVDRGATGDDFFADGSLLLSMDDSFGGPGLFRLPPGEGKPVPVLVTPFSESNPSLTRDGRWLAYVGDSTGREEIYVRALGTGEEWRVSKEGGSSPVWRKDGRELFYLDARGVIVALPTTLGAAFSAGPPQDLFPALLDDTSSSREYDVSPDGSRFILNRRKDRAEQPMLVQVGLPQPGSVAR
jgi:Tol biopolymer transport system component